MLKQSDTGSWSGEKEEHTHTLTHSLNNIVDTHPPFLLMQFENADFTALTDSIQQVEPFGHTEHTVPFYTHCDCLVISYSIKTLLTSIHAEQNCS